MSNIVSPDVLSAIKLSELIDRKLAANHPLPASSIKKYKMEPIDILHKSHLNVKLGVLYRRYRAVYLMGLQGAICIVQNSANKEEAVASLRCVIKDIGKLEKSGKKKCAESSV